MGHAGEVAAAQAVLALQLSLWAAWVAVPSPVRIMQSRPVLGFSGSCGPQSSPVSLCISVHWPAYPVLGRALREPWTAPEVAGGLRNWARVGSVSVGLGEEELSLQPPPLPLQLPRRAAQGLSPQAPAAHMFTALGHLPDPPLALLLGNEMELVLVHGTGQVEVTFR